MRVLSETNQFKRDLKKAGRAGACAFEELETVLDMLANDAPLPARLRDHALSGPWKRLQARDCHIRPDLVLVYAKPPGELLLLRLGSHSELFE